MVRLQGPENCGGFAHQGELFSPDPAGVIAVPRKALAAALAHGYRPLVDKERPGPDEENGAYAPALRLHHAGFGRYFLLAADGLRVNAKPLSKTEAERLLAAVESGRGE